MSPFQKKIPFLHKSHKPHVTIKIPAGVKVVTVLPQRLKFGVRALLMSPAEREIREEKIQELENYTSEAKILLKISSWALARAVIWL